MESSSLATDYWEETLDEFRALGGIAENVRVGIGENGRGFFSVDPARESRVWVPPELLVPVEHAVLKDGRLTVVEGKTDERIAAFFDRYQDRLGWTALRESSFATQRAWSELPDDVRNALLTSGTLSNNARFMPPTDETALAEFVHSRAGVFKPDGRFVFIPVLELVNHRPGAPPYRVDEGVGVHGTFPQEVLVRYNEFDAIELALNYSFAAANTFALSVGITVDLPGGRALSIRRHVKEQQLRNGYPMPVLTEHANVLDLSFLVLGHLTAPVLPRAVFRELLKPYLSRDETDTIFDGIAHFNRSRWIAFLRTLRKHSGRLITVLEDAVINQLEALSASVGGSLSS